MRNMKKVAVLLASYNGERYIGMQIESIMRQSYPNIELYIRDDRSTDGTVDIIKGYADKYDRIHLIESDVNLGYPGCFYALTDDISIEADYYAFADQDDYWLKNKISRAVSVLEEQDSEIACSYYSGYMMCNSNLKAKKKSRPRKNNEISFVESLFEVCGLEFTQVVNAEAMKLIRTYKPQKASARGTWMSPLISGMGKVVYDNYCSAYYRRHESAVTNSDTGMFGIWIWRIREFLFGGFDEYRVLLEDINAVMGPELSGRNRKALELFSAEKNVHNQLRKALYPKRLRSGIVDELALRFMFLIWRL